MAEMIDCKHQPMCHYVRGQNYTKIHAHSFVAQSPTILSDTCHLSLLGLLAKIKV